MSDVIIRKLYGVDAERVKIKSEATRIIREVFSHKFASDRGTRKDWLAPPRLKEFTEMEPICFGSDAPDWFIFNPAECTPDIVWPLRCGIICGAGDEAGMRLTNIRSVTMKEVRGYAARFSPFMVRMDHGQVYDGRLVTAASLFAWLGGQWVDAQKRTVWEGDRAIKLGDDFDGRTAEMPRCMTAVALRQRYEWAVSLGFAEAPSIRFATDPSGIKDLFKLRDVAEGRDRRDALLTWVSDHWRQSRSDPDVESYVRKHLRGQDKFEWNGMVCEIKPAQFDVEKRDALMAERNQMRAAGTDMRASLHQ